MYVLSVKGTTSVEMGYLKKKGIAGVQIKSSQKKCSVKYRKKIWINTVFVQIVWNESAEINRQARV